jgi:hypothetical protein
MDAETRCIVRHLSEADRCSVTTALEIDLVDFDSKIDERLRSVPALDNYRAVKLQLRFSGSAKLDQTSGDDLALLQAARLGEPIRLIVLGEVGAKGFTLKRDSFGDQELGFTCTVTVLSVEAGEPA